jgi:tRNA (guanine37-N1)-methyltransferase
MLTFHVITLFPELIETYCSTSILGRGQSAEKWALKTYNPRDFCLDKYRRVDDTPYGGGAGMVLKPEPIFQAFESIKRHSNSPVLLLSPHGAPFSHTHAARLAANQEITVICGHYEGIDERVKTLVTEEISVGDYVLTGGELPALIVIDAVSRLIPGVLGKAESLQDESFTHGLLEAPQYTKPAVYRNMEVPEVLRSGDHAAIALWRRLQALRVTFKKRPDLLETLKLDKTDRRFLDSLGKDKESENLLP